MMVIKVFVWSIFLCFLAGLPISFKLGKKEDKLSAIVISPIIGFSTLVAILKIFVGFDIPIKFIAWPIIIMFFLIFALWIFSTYKSGKKKCIKIN